MKDYDYDNLSKYYPILEENESEDLSKNIFIENILKKNKVKNILDVSCGTGIQTIFLSKKGYDLWASDLSKNMLSIAKKRSKQNNLNINFKHANMIDVSYNFKADAVISIFNSIGHLSEKDFVKMIKNTYNNLKEKGLFLFDIFNFDFMNKNMIFGEFIDSACYVNNTYFVRFNNNSLNKKDQKLIINQKTYIQKGVSNPKIICEKWDMKIYDFKRLNKLLTENGFEIIESYGNFKEIPVSKDAISIFIIARKL